MHGPIRTNTERDTGVPHESLMLLVHYRHETPVLANPIKLIHVDEDLVVLDKPCSLPVSTVCSGHKIQQHQKIRGEMMLQFIRNTWSNKQLAWCGQAETQWQI